MADYLWRALTAYADKNRSAAHTPGHAAGRLVPPRLARAWGRTLFAFDQTELPGLDVLSEDEKAEIESEKEQVAAARTELESKGSELAEVQAEAERVLEELNQSVASVQAESDRIAEEKAQASAEIDQWWKDYYAQLAEQENQQNNGSSGSSGGSSGSIGSGGYVSTGNFTWPVPGFTNISCGYSSGHKAIDISGGGRTIYGTPIVAADSGKVVTATYHYSYGNYVMIDHGGGYSTLYAHASSLAVSAGQTVTKGQTIAYVGSTGNSTGPHLHFEVRVNGNRQNPFNWFS